MNAPKALAMACLLAGPTLAQTQQSSLPSVPPDVAAARAALAKYQDPIVAVHDGYFSTVGCIEYPSGGMGVHFLNLQRIGPVPDSAAPQVLIYEPVGDSLRLVAAEWFVPLATGVKERPRIFGQALEGPMEGHHPIMPRELHPYDLHVWLWKANPAGLFATTNPTLKCTGAPYAMMENPPPTVQHR